MIFYLFASAFFLYFFVVMKKAAERHVVPATKGLAPDALPDSKNASTGTDASIGTPTSTKHFDDVFLKHILTDLEKPFRHETKALEYFLDQEMFLSPAKRQFVKYFSNLQTPALPEADTLDSAPSNTKPQYRHGTAREDSNKVVLMRDYTGR